MEEHLQALPLSPRVSRLEVQGICDDVRDFFRFESFLNKVSEEFCLSGEKLELAEEIADRLQLNDNDKYSILEKGFTWQPAGLNDDEVCRHELQIEPARL